MDDPPPDGPSMDPRTWLKLGSVPPAETTTPTPQANTSFNPKAWSQGQAAIRPEPPSKPRPRAPLAFIIVATCGLLAAGGAWLMWPKSKAPVATASAAQITTAADTERHALTVSGAGDIQAILTGAGASPADAAKISALATAKLLAGPGDLTVIVMVQPASGGAHIASLDARHENGAGVVVQADTHGGFSATQTTANLKTVVKVVRGEMDAYGFYSSAVAQHLTDSLISPFAQALAFDFDFQREIHAGDIFEAAFEDRLNPRGESVGVGRLLYVSLETQAKSRALYWFQPQQGQAGWFDANGASVVRSLMRTPVESARISSTFGMREHPVLGFVKMHKGVDFAAPIGTPIYASGDGVIEFAGMKGPNGNFVKIKHDNGWETLYLHMSAYGEGITEGARVHQGQKVGAIGTTGRSTGPHLHYEVHIAGEPVDPMALKLDSGQTLRDVALKAFLKERDRIDALRATQNG